MTGQWSRQYATIRLPESTTVHVVVGDHSVHGKAALAGRQAVIAVLCRQYADQFDVVGQFFENFPRRLAGVAQKIGAHGVTHRGGDVGRQRLFVEVHQAGARRLADEFDVLLNGPFIGRIGESVLAGGR